MLRGHPRDGKHGSQHDTCTSQVSHHAECLHAAYKEQ